MQGTLPPTARPAGGPRPLLIVGVVGLLASAVAGVLSQRVASLQARASAEREAERVSAAVAVGLGQTLESVHAVAQLASAYPDLDRAAFDAFAAPALARHPALAALEWAPRVRDAERGAFEARVSAALGVPWRIRQPGAGGGMVPAPARGEYLPLLHMVPWVPDVAGLDVVFEPERRAAVTKAVDGAGLSISPRMRLVEDPPGIHSVFASLPVYRGSTRPAGVEERRAAFAGLAIALFRVRPAVERSLESGAAALPPGARLAVVDLDAPSADHAALHESAPGAATPAGDDWVHRRPLPFGDRRWEVVVARAPAGTSAAAWGVFGLGVLLTVATGLGVRARERLAALGREVAAARQLGQYTLERKLGEGGMGTVYLARHALLRRPTAVKVLRADRDDPAALARFEREVRITSELCHPNTVAVYDFGVTPDGSFYYAMEHLDGVTLEGLVEECGPQPPARVARILRQIAGSLAEAHDRGLVHRDVKPANVMLTLRGGVPDFVKVLDFGLAKHQETATKVTRADALLGTPHFMAPEAMTDSAGAGAPADVWALGVVGYWLCTGELPFDGDGVLAIASRVMTLEPAAVSSRSSVPPASPLEVCIARCLAKDPAARPTARVLIASLGEALDGLPPWTDEQALAWWTEIGAPLVERLAERSTTVSTGGAALQVELRARGATRPRA